MLMLEFPVDWLTLQLQASAAASNSNK